MVITPTLTYPGGTWTLSQKHENMIKTAQRKMLRLIEQAKRKYKPKKDAVDKKERRSTSMLKKNISTRPTKKLKRAQIKTPI